VFGCIIVVGQHVYPHVRDVTTVIDEQWQSMEDKSAPNSTTNVSFSPIIIESVDSIYTDSADTQYIYVIIQKYLSKKTIKL